MFKNVALANSGPWQRAFGWTGMLLLAPLAVLGGCGHSSHTSAAGYIASDPRHWIGHGTVGTGECVALVQEATGAPRTAGWRPGPLVEGNGSIQPGTAIATFDRNDHYAGHAAIYLKQDELGIHVIDQWIQRQGNRVIGEHQPSERILPIGDARHAQIDRGELYHMIRS